MKFDAEEWRSAAGHEGIFEVSSHGGIRSVTRVVRTRHGHSRRISGRVLRGYINPNGYIQIGRRIDGVSKPFFVHVMVCETFHGPPPPDRPLVRHLDSNPLNNRSDNLAWGNKSENALDAIALGRWSGKNRKTCPRGHELIEPNIRADARRDGQRKCLACNRAQAHCKYYGNREDMQRISDGYYQKIMNDGVQSA